MSEFTRLMAISFFGMIGFITLYYLSKFTNDVGDQILTGFIGEHLITNKDRWALLYNRYLTSALGTAVFGYFVAMGAALMANHASDDGTKLFARLLAFYGAMICFKWLVQGFTQFLHFRRQLRPQAEAD